MGSRIHDRTYRSAAELVRAIRDEHVLEAIGLDSWLLANRVVWPALEAGVPLVIGGEFAAALQGVPIGEPEMVLHVRLPDLDAFHRVVRTAHGSLGVLGSSLGTLAREDVTVGSELAVIALGGLIRVLMVDEPPAAKMISVERWFVEDRTPVDVPVVPLVELLESGAVGSVTTALAERLLQRGL
ncbi:MAG: hypothetical protein ACRDS0_12610 [Pseudonocardiaceae bacterium]